MMGLPPIGSQNAAQLQFSFTLPFKLIIEDQTALICESRTADGHMSWL